ncbi:GNAT family N-acetyltransferase [Vibrio sp. SCSIO 43136]|uniref:GNAT family N-acetyltransferase n=1 Tax=Vibrio sp. SCSIO 43136 TaxID=2819101 RepID=UPI0020759EF7|nr:GNAT family N-acetyltransferase [Vibrio sp. SCSIO 43136]USD67061.1 GNAT family N-acetyltransferase [Vibrio sp. SCSIO 43136]
MIREMTLDDFKSFWPTFTTVVQAQQTYAFDPEMTFEQAYALWCEATLKTFVFIQDGNVLGSYYIKPNGMGPSAHICNCGYMVSEQARGKGVARQLCVHSQSQALALGFKAMQFNSVVSTNTVAVELWKRLGFSVVGQVPNAYKHAQLGYVDTLVMYKWLERE